MNSRVAGMMNINDTIKNVVRIEGMNLRKQNISKNIKKREECIHMCH